MTFNLIKIKDLLVPSQQGKRGRPRKNGRAIVLLNGCDSKQVNLSKMLAEYFGIPASSILRGSGNEKNVNFSVPGVAVNVLEVFSLTKGGVTNGGVSGKKTVAPTVLATPVPVVATAKTQPENKSEDKIEPDSFPEVGGTAIFNLSESSNDDHNFDTDSVMASFMAHVAKVREILVEDQKRQEMQEREPTTDDISALESPATESTYKWVGTQK